MRKKYLHYIFAFILLYYVFPAFVQAQNDYKSEADLKKQAAKIFDKEDYTAAYPLYSQLLSLYPKDGDYNYKFGVCILLSTGDKEKPIPYLEFAAKQPDVDKDVFYYLAKAYHLNYRFDDAIAMYQKYKSVGSKSQIEKFQIDRQIEMCQNGKKLLQSISGLDVIDKKELTTDDYFLSYNLPDIGGKLLVEPDDFKTSYDKKKNVSSIIYLSNNHNQIYYSSYGKDGKNGKDIYVIRKLPSGDWSKPENVGAPINTQYDEDYPFLHPDGKTLYFCSKGHNSMGGYDIFKSTWNDTTKTWGEPVNLDFPINTPADDILYITDTDEKMAYFSSNRSSPDGKIMIYKINVARKPVDISIIKGAIVKTEDKQNLDSKITVQNMETNEIVGIYKANDSTGNYFMNLPNGGKFLFTVETNGFKTQSSMVSIPVQYELKPLKQEISYEASSGKLVIKNMFDQPVDDNNYLLAMNYIKQRAKMDISSSSDTSSSKNNSSGNTAVANNATQNNNNNALSANQNSSSNPNGITLKDSIASADNSSNDSTSTASNDSVASSDSTATTSHPNLSNSDIVKIAYNDANESDKEAKDMQNQANAALSMANEKNEETKDKNADADQLLAKANQTQDPTQKQAALDDYNNAKKEANQSAKATIAAFNIATQLQSDATAKRKEADFSQQYAKQLDNAVSSNSSNSDEALKQMASEKDSLDKMNQQPVGTDNVYNNLKTDVDNKQAEADDASQTLTNNQQQLANLNSNISQMQAQADTSSNQTLKQALQSQVSELKTERIQKQKDIVAETKKASELQDEANNLKDQLSVSSGMITQIKNGAQNSSNSDVSSIDKQKLQAEVSSYKEVNMSDTTSDANNAQANQANNSVASSDSSAQNNTAETANNSVANADSTTNYAAKYSNAITEAEKITDDYNRDEAEAAIYSDWANAIKNDIADKKNNLETIKAKKEKKSAEKAIAGLQKDFSDKQNLSQQFTDKGNALKQSLASSQNNNSGNTNTASDSSQVSSQNNAANNQIASNTNPQNGNNSNTQNADNASDTTNVHSQNNAANNQTASNTNPQNGNNSNTQNTNTASDSSQVNSQNNTTNNQTATNTNPQNGNNSNTQNTNNASDSSQVNSENNAANNEVASTTNSPNANTEVTNNSVAPAKIYSSQAALNNDNQAKQSEDAAAKSDDKYNALMEQAASEKDTAQKAQLIADANNAQIQAQQSQLQAESAYAKANQIQNQKNNQEIAQLSQATASKNADDLLIAGAMNDDATTHFKNAQNYRNEAAQESDNVQKEAFEKQARDEESLALTKQQKAIAIYSKYAPEVAANFNESQNQQAATNTQNNAVANNTQQVNNASNGNAANQQTAANLNSTTQNNSAANNAQQANNASNGNAANQQNTNTATQNNSAANNSQQANTSANGNLANQQNANSTTANNQQIKNTPEYKQYVTTINQSDYLEALATTDFSSADNYKKIAQMQADSASKNRAAADTISDSQQKQDALNKAQTELAEATANKNKSDSLTALANQNQSAAISKKADAATYIGSLDTQTAAAIKAVSPAAGNNENTNTSANNANLGNETASTTNPTNVNTTADNGNSATNTQNNAANNSSSNGNALNNPTSSTSNNNANNQTAASNNSTVSTNVANQNTNAAENATTISLTDTFEASQTPVYSAAHPIPINPPLPNGIYYKVQVGAFRNKIPQDLFKGMEPLMGETTPQGFIRYTAGMFTAADKANAVKSKIVAMGFTDAFVVAFINGKRVSMDQALAAATQNANGNNNAANNNGSTQNVAENANNQNANTSQNNISENATNTAVSTDVVQVKGLFYTVQVGVYLHPEPAAKLFNIQPLYSEKTANGFIRYNSGVFNDFDKATAAKNVIVQIGIKDAFVTAYYNGKRINPDKAKALIASGNAKFTSDANVNVMPGQSNQAVVPNQNNAENTVAENSTQNTNSTQVETQNQTQNTNTPVANTSDNKVVFKVQIGAYKNQIPLTMANKFLSLGGNGVKTYVDENGITIYTTGNFSAFNDAVALKNKIVTEGIPDAFVTAFRNGKKITLDEAQKLIH